MSVDLGRGTRRFQRFVTLGGAKPSRRAAAAARHPRPRPAPVGPPARVPQARPAAADQEPGDVRRRDHRGPGDADLARQRHRAAARARRRPARGFQLQIAIWLWFTVLFATYAEAVAEARGRAQAATLRRTRSETTAHRRRADGTLEAVGSSELRKGDVIVVEEGEVIPGDGDVIEGVGFVNEAAITGESAPVLKEPGTDIRSSVTGGTTLVSDRLVIRVTTDPGETFLDRMIALVEGAKRQRTPNEIALAILLAGLTIVFLMATVTLRPFGEYAGTTVETVALIALLVCLIPTTIGGLLSAIGIAGMDRVARFNVLAMSGRAVEASGDVDVILLDKTGTITYGNRLASSIIAGARRGRGGRPAGRARRVDPRRDPGRPVGRRPRARSASPSSALPAGNGDDAGVRGARRDHRRGDPVHAPRPARAGSALTDGALVLKGAVDAITASLDGPVPAEVTRRDRADRRRAARRRSRSARTAGSSA